jgi:signal transduction histidine kinase
VLADEGLAAALEVLAEEAPIAMRLGALPDARLGADVETAGYFVVSDLVSRSHAGRVDVDARRIDGRLVIELSCDGPLEDLVDLEDRVGALDGGLNVVRGPDGRARIRVEIPCGS